MKPTTRAATIFLVFFALQIFAIWLAESGLVDFPQTLSDRVVAAFSSLVLLIACAGLFVGARWGWFAALFYIYGALLDGIRSSALDDEFGFPTIFALGVWIAISSLLLSLLDSKSLREALDPQPPTRSLPWRLFGKVGLALSAASLIGSIWGFLILGTWLGLMAWTTRRRKIETERASKSDSSVSQSSDPV